MLSFLERIAIWSVVSVVVFLLAGRSTDAAAYTQRLGSVADVGAVEFFADSGLFYLLFGSRYALQSGQLESMYFIVWTVLFVGMTALGFRVRTWILFFAFFPGFDLVLNVVRQSFALGVFGMFAAWPVVGYFAALVSHPLAVFTIVFDALTARAGAISRRTVLMSGCAVAAALSVAWIVSVDFRIILATKLLGKIGVNPFGLGFILRVWLTLALLAALSGLVLRGSRRVIALVSLGVVALGILVTPYLYRLLYAFYPMLVLGLDDGIAELPFNARFLLVAVALALGGVNLVALVS